MYQIYCRSRVQRMAQERAMKSPITQNTVEESANRDISETSVLHAYMLPGLWLKLHHSVMVRGESREATPPT